LKDIIIIKSREKVTFLNQGKEVYPFVEVFINGKYAGAFSIKSELSIRLPKSEQVKNIYITGYAYGQGGTDKVQRDFTWREPLASQGPTPYQGDFRAGDILVACDNVDGLPYGYMGHAAIVVDEKNIIEGVTSDPIIRKVPISQFTLHHPMYAHYRPKSREIGKQAASYAEKYLTVFQENKKDGVNRPLFYFTINTPLTDEWTYIYCSKLVWLSYHYGANYTFINDHLWFSPEDLYTNLSSLDEFELMYKHPNYQFIIDL
jgi:hypothetical protein